MMKDSNSYCSNSSDDDDNDDEILIEELEKKILLNPNVGEFYEKLIQVLRSNGMLEKLRKVREEYVSHTIVQENIWIDWLNDEMKLWTVTGPDLLRNRFRQAIDENPSSIALWSLYLDFEILHVGEKQPNDCICRSLFARAGEILGHHFLYGNLFWEKYLSFEESRDPSKYESIKSTKASAMIKGNANPLVTEMEEYEKLVVDGTPTMWIAYINFIQEKSKHTSQTKTGSLDAVIASLYLRAMQACLNDTNLWTRGLRYMQFYKKDAFCTTLQFVKKRNPKLPELYLQSLVHMENEFGGNASQLTTQLKSLLDLAVTHLARSHPEVWSDLFLQACFVMKRSFYSQPVFDQGFIQTLFDQYAWSLGMLQATFPKWYQGQLEIIQSWSDMAWRLQLLSQNMLAIENLWLDLMDRFRHQTDIIAKAIGFLTTCATSGTVLHTCRKIFKQQLYYAVTEGEKLELDRLASLWIHVENQHGTLDSIKAAMLQIQKNRVSVQVTDGKRYASKRPRTKTIPDHASPENKKAKPTSEIVPTKAEATPNAEIDEDCNEEDRTVFVVNLSFKTQENELQTFLKQHHFTTRSVHLLKTKHGKSKGLAHVVLDTKASAQRAIQELKELSLGGRTLEFREYKKDNKQLQTTHQALSNPLTTVYVGKFPKDFCNEAALLQGSHPISEALRDCGAILSVSILSDGVSALVEYANVAGAESAIQNIHDKTFSWNEDTVKRTLAVRICKETKQQRNTSPDTKEPAKPIALVPRALQPRRKRANVDFVTQSEPQPATSMDLSDDSKPEAEKSGSGMKTNDYFRQLMMKK